MQVSNTIIFILMSISFLCCQGDSIEMNREEYQTFFKNSKQKLQKTQKIDDKSYSIQFLPNDYVAIMQVEESDSAKNLVENKINEMKGMYFFTLRIDNVKDNTPVLKSGINDMSVYKDRIDFVSFKMQKDLTLIANNKNYPCVLYSFERTFDMTRYIDFSIAFDIGKDPIPNEITVKLNANYWDAGILNFHFTQKDLLGSLPKLKL